MKYRLIEFPHFNDSRGSLTPFELDDKFPFVVKRVYTVTGNPGEVRGAHAHLQESEVFVAVSGTIVATIDDGKKCERITLDHPSKALYVGTMCWHEFLEFSKDAVLLCFSSTHYLPGETNYITDREAFYDLIKAQSA